jgi:hypothetical protein
MILIDYIYFIYIKNAGYRFLSAEKKTSLDLAHAAMSEEKKLTLVFEITLKDVFVEK